ncbi:hypothetical protein J2S41_002455 [Catenuloplanes atrovinosus]|uniref:Uncharacterized protein n=1 Tax=Catenuloplanes atrovinosus TaxID=137266 RepID=A0AAE3YMB6_9ACTN|nr:hypothetical protein [Catenuloplanes atrovinosus]
MIGTEVRWVCRRSGPPRSGRRPKHVTVYRRSLLRARPAPAVLARQRSRWRPEEGRCVGDDPRGVPAIAPGPPRASTPPRCRPRSLVPVRPRAVAVSARTSTYARSRPAGAAPTGCGRRGSGCGSCRSDGDDPAGPKRSSAPAAAESRSAAGSPRHPTAHRGSHRLHDGYLLRWDLFRRLRTRAETAGPDGIADLGHALEVVRGQPLAVPTSPMPPATAPVRVAAGQRHPAATAPTSTSQFRLDAGDLAGARWAVDIAWQADQERADDHPWLDVIRIAHHAGHRAEVRTLWSSSGPGICWSSVPSWSTRTLYTAITPLRTVRSKTWIMKPCIGKTSTGSSTTRTSKRISAPPICASLLVPVNQYVGGHVHTYGIDLVAPKSGPSGRAR